MDKNETIKYAPGFSSYGIKGATGSKGKDGTSFHYTKYILSSYITDSVETNSERTEAIRRLRAGLSLHGDEAPVDRAYSVGDVIIDGGGSFFEVIYNGGLDLSKSPLFSLQDWGANAINGVIPSDVNREVTEAVFVRKNDRLVLTPKLKGVDVVSPNVTDEELTKVEGVQPNSPMRVIGNLTMQHNGNNVVPLQSFVSYDANGIPTYLTLYYDKSLDAWGISSDAPLVLDLSIYSGSKNDKASRNIEGYTKLTPSSVGWKRSIYKSFFSKDANIPARKDVPEQPLMKFIHSGGELKAFIYLNQQFDGEPVKSEFVGYLTLKSDDISQVGVSSVSEYTKKINEIRDTIIAKYNEIKKAKSQPIAIYLTILDSIEMPINYM